MANGSYVCAILQVDDRAKLTISTKSVSWLKNAGENRFAVYGSIDITGSKVTSLDTSKGAPLPQTSSGTTSRAYINLRESEGGIIRGAEIAYFGYSYCGKRRKTYHDVPMKPDDCEAYSPLTALRKQALRKKKKHSRS